MLKLKSVETAWHSLTVEDVFANLQTTSRGLSNDEAEQRLKSFGPNRLPQPVKRNGVFRFLVHFHNVLIYVLIGSAIITALLDHLFDTFVILAVVVANAIIGFVQEGKAEKALDAIRHMLAPNASVLRNGEQHIVEAENLVPGDVVSLEPGDKVPADLRLLRAHGLHIQEAILTGESVPSEKSTKVIAADAVLGDRKDMAFSGTLVTSGQCTGVVVATGVSTQVGQISGLLSAVETLTTPLVKQMNVFAKWLTLLILVLATLLLVFGYFVEHHDFTEIFMAVVGLSVAAIPEGLPAVLTITLAVGVHSMARRNVIVRCLPAIETLGSVSVICTDKTGTLTQNEMIVASVATPSHIFSVGGIGYEPKGVIKHQDQVINGDDHTILPELARAAALCNNAALREDNDDWVVVGDPMEGALLSFAGKIGIDIGQEKSLWARTDTIPFDTKHRFMATLHHNHEKCAYIYVKGAPEQILSMCREQLTMSGDRDPIDEKYWHDKAHEIASEGQRVLALGYRQVDVAHTVLEFSDVEGPLILLGMVGLIDPPRPEAIEAIAECHRAGIRVKMITGDHAGTASAIGRQIGLQNPDKVLTGYDLDTIDDPTLAAVALETDIFARTSPEHKLRLVMALQSHGMTVAMTGDGVNDAPSLKRADAGIAMGKKGSEAAKEAAELVLVDDNFSSIAAAVREGRTVYDNLKKVISWTLPTNAGEALTIVVALLFGMTLPITPIQILWINLITAVTLGMALAFEPTEENSMRRPPRPRNEPLLTGDLGWHIVFVSTLFLCSVFGIYFYAIDRGYSLELARTMGVNTLVVLEIFHLFFIRNIYGTSLTWKALRGTRMVWMAVIVITAAQFAVTYVPLLQSIFSTQAVPIFDGILIIGIGVTLFFLLEIEKQIRITLKRQVTDYTTVSDPTNGDIRQTH